MSFNCIKNVADKYISEGYEITKMEILKSYFKPNHIKILMEHYFIVTDHGYEVMHGRRYRRNLTFIRANFFEMGKFVKEYLIEEESKSLLSKIENSSGGSFNRVML